MGIVTLLRSILLPPPPGPPPSTRKPPRISIYGPAGIRTFVRQNLKMTRTRMADNYTVHELLSSTDSITPCVLSADPDDLAVADHNVLHCNEVAGSDLRSSPRDGLWRAIASDRGLLAPIVVDASPIHHRDPCIGYVFSEQMPHGRKLVILGDTHDPSPILPLCTHPPPSLLIHEATYAHIPAYISAGKFSQRSSPVTIREKALLRGHSVPDMAGAFANRIGAERLVLNHIGARFPAPRNDRDPRAAVIAEIALQATRAWGAPGKSAVVAYDFMTVQIQPRLPSPAASAAFREMDDSEDKPQSS